MNLTVDVNHIMNLILSPDRKSHELGLLLDDTHNDGRIQELYKDAMNMLLCDLFHLIHSEILFDFRLKRAEFNQIHLSNMESLRDVDLIGAVKCKRLVIKNCPNLKALRIRIKHIQSVIIENCSNLCSISLGYLGIEEIDINQCPDLQYCKLDGNNIKHLDLDRHKLQYLIIDKDVELGFDIHGIKNVKLCS